MIAEGAQMLVVAVAAVIAILLVCGFVIGYVVGDIRGWRRSMRELRELVDRYGWGAVEEYLKDELGVRP